MKRWYPLFLVLFVFLAATCSAQKAKWKEMEEFHGVMSETFHPAEEGKLGPIKSRSQEMLDKAIAWKNSTAPEGYDKSTVEKTLKELVKGAKEVNKMVKDNASDEALKERLSGLHDVFHEIMEKCEKH
jgi:hypothetical protein